MRSLVGEPSHRGPIRRFDAVLGGPIWWACHLGASYWLTPRLCRWGVEWPVHVVTVALLVLIGRALLSGIQIAAAGRRATDAPGASRDVFLGWTGSALSLFFGAVILAEWVPVLQYDPCW